MQYKNDFFPTVCKIVLIMASGLFRSGLNIERVTEDTFSQ